MKSFLIKEQIMEDLSANNFFENPDQAAEFLEVTFRNVLNGYSDEMDHVDIYQTLQTISQKHPYFCRGRSTSVS